MEAYLNSLLEVDFGLPCPGGWIFCSVCQKAVCKRCCPEHQIDHHGVGPRCTLDIAMLAGAFPAVSALSVRTTGFGYAWSKIERVEHEGTSWVMLGRERPVWRHNWLQGRCKHCRDRIPVQMDHCSPRCKVATVRSGKSRDIVQKLVDFDYRRKHFFDTFCTGCQRAFSSLICDDHHHHHDATEDFQVFNIVREDGWLLINQYQLPGDLTDGIKTVEMEDGNLGVPVRARLLPNPCGGTKLCDRDEPHDCMEAVEEGDSVCSICCKVIVGQ